MRKLARRSGWLMQAAGWSANRSRSGLTGAVEEVFLELVEHEEQAGVGRVGRGLDGGVAAGRWQLGLGASPRYALDRGGDRRHKLRDGIVLHEGRRPRTVRAVPRRASYRWRAFAFAMPTPAAATSSCRPALGIQQREPGSAQLVMTLPASASRPKNHAELLLVVVKPEVRAVAMLDKFRCRAHVSSSPNFSRGIRPAPSRIRPASIDTGIPRNFARTAARVRPDRVRRPSSRSRRVCPPRSSAGRL